MTVVREAWLKQRFEDLRQCLRDQTIDHRGNAQLSHSPSVWLRDLHQADRARFVSTIQYCGTDILPVPRQVDAQVLDRHLVDVRRALVAFHPLQGTRHVHSFDHRFEKRHRFRTIGLLTRQYCLVCGLCASGQRFACSFLQTHPRGGALAAQLAVPLVGPAED